LRQSSSSVMFVLFFLVLTGWIAWVALQEISPEEPDLQVTRKTELWDEVEGNIIRHKSYNDRGEWTLEVHAEKIEQLPGGGTAITGTRAQYRRPNGKVLRVSADHLRDEGNNKVFSSDKGHRIVLEEEDGLHCETEGPLTVTPDTEFFTEHKTTFEMGSWTGSCGGLSYKPDEELRLTSGIDFKLSSRENASTLKAEEINFQFQKGIGEVEHGHFQMISTNTGAAYFESKKMILHYSGEPGGMPVTLREIEILGNESELFWNEGGIKAPYFSICMDMEGTYPELISTHDQTEFNLMSLHGQSIHGVTGNLLLDFFETRPLSLSGDSELNLTADSRDGSVLSLTGGKGFLTEFSQGQAENTHIYGTPEFEFGSVRGRAGTFRILHEQRKLMLSQTAELLESSKNTRISAEEILVSNWDLPDREVFGRAFIQFQGFIKDELVEGTGNEVFFSAYKNQLVLKGSPAMFQGKRGMFSSKTIDIANDENDNLVFQATDDVQAKVNLAEHSYEILCRAMNYNGNSMIFHLQNVEKFSSEGWGTLSGETLELFLEQPDSPVLKKIEVRGKVQVTGTSRKGDRTVTFSGQSDKMDFDALSQIMTLESDHQDVTFQQDTGYEIRGRRLIYSLRDATMRVEAGEHRSTQTIVNIKKEKSK